jgi:hypothetical protein
MLAKYHIIYMGDVKQCPRHLLSILKKEIKEKFNIGKVTFYISKVLNAHTSRQNFYYNMLNHCPESIV